MVKYDTLLNKTLHQGSEALNPEAVETEAPTVATEASSVPEAPNPEVTEKKNTKSTKKEKAIISQVQKILFINNIEEGGSGSGNHNRGK